MIRYLTVTAASSIIVSMDQLGPDPALGGGADVRLGQLRAAQEARQVQLVVEPVVKALPVEDVAAGKPPDAVSVGEAAEAHRARRPLAHPPLLRVVEGEGPIGEEVVRQDDEARTEGRLGVGSGCGQWEEAKKNRPEMDEGRGGGG